MLAHLGVVVAGEGEGIYLAILLVCYLARHGSLRGCVLFFLSLSITVHTLRS